MLAKIDASTEVAVREDVEVAGRAAYNLVLTPRSEGTLVESVAVAVDGENGLAAERGSPRPRTAEPAFRTAFSSLKLEAPDAALFNFTPPPGATVKELALPGRPPRRPRLRQGPTGPGKHANGTGQPPAARQDPVGDRLRLG